MHIFNEIERERVQKPNAVVAQITFDGLLLLR